MAQSQFGDGPPGRIDHAPGRGAPPTERLEHRLTPHRGGLDCGRFGRDAQQPNHIQTPSTGPRDGVGSPERGQRRTRQDRVDPAVIT